MPRGARTGRAPGSPAEALAVARGIPAAGTGGSAVVIGVGASWRRVYASTSARLDIRGCR